MYSSREEGISLPRANWRVSGVTPSGFLVFKDQITGDTTTVISPKAIARVTKGVPKGVYIQLHGDKTQYFYDPDSVDDEFTNLLVELEHGMEVLRTLHRRA